MNQYRDKLVKYIVDNPKKAFGVFILLNFIFLPGFAFLKTDFTYKAWYSERDPQVQLFQDFERTFGNDDSLIIVIKDKEGILNKKTLTAISEMTDTMWNTKEIIRVDSLNNFQFNYALEDDLIVEDLVDADSIETMDMKELERKIDSEPILEGYLISQDKTATIVQAFVRPAIKDIPDQSAITHDVRAKLEAFQKKYPHLETHLSGPVTIVDDFKMATIHDMALLIPLLYLMFTVLLYWKYKSIPTIFMIFTTISASTVLMLGAAGYAGQKINTLTSACPTILMTVALSDAVHIFSAFFFALSNKFSIESSLYYSLKKNFFPTLLTSLTTGVGFLSFYDAKVEPVAELGIIVCFGVLFAWLVTYYMLGPLILIFSKYFKQFEIGQEESKDIEQKITPTKSAINATAWLKKYRVPIVAASIILAGLSVYKISKLKVNMDPMAQFAQTHHSVVANKFLEENFGYTSVVEMMIDSGKPEGAKDPDLLHKVEDYIDWLNSQDAFFKTLSLNSVLKSLNKSLHGDKGEYYKIPNTNNEVAEYLLLYSMGLPQGKDINNLISLNNQKLHLSSQWNLRDSHTSLKTMDKIRQKAKELDLNVELTGKTLLFHELTPYIVTTFFESIAMAFVGITIVLIISLKSLSLGLLALIPNLFPLLVGGFLFYFTGYDIDMGTVIVASVCLGIAVDDSIHFLFEYKKYRGQGNKSSEAIEKLLTSTYPALFMTTLLISVGFSSFVFGSYVPNVKFGLCVAGILIIALIADFVVLPAIMLLKERD
jgi:predicted RND superfamily exporter protein